MAQMKRISVTMDELFVALACYAKELGLSKAEVVRRCLWVEFGPPAKQG